MSTPSAVTEMPYFEPKPKDANLTIRYPEDLREDLREISSIWSDVSEALGRGEKVSLNDVIVRLLKIGNDGVWAEYGGKPTNAKERAALIERLVAAYKRSEK